MASQLLPDDAHDNGDRSFMFSMTQDAIEPDLVAIAVGCSPGSKPGPACGTHANGDQLAAGLGFSAFQAGLG